MKGGFLVEFQKLYHYQKTQNPMPLSKAFTGFRQNQVEPRFTCHTLWPSQGLSYQDDISLAKLTPKSDVAENVL